MTILKSQSLKMKYGQDNHVLEFPDIEISAHDRVLLLGESGCGKTTLLSILAGFLRPIEGKVLLNGIDIYSLKNSERDRIRSQNLGFIFQTLHLIPSLTVERNILLAAELAKIKMPAARLNQILTSLGLSDKAHSRPDELSQGEQQRAALARAILNTPSLIIADEPTSALDDLNAEKSIDILEQQANSSGSALLVATHDNRIKHRFDKVILLSTTRDNR